MSWNNQGGGPWRSPGRGPWGQGPFGPQPPGELEEIVGDILDEHDVAVQGVRKQRDGSVVVDGSATIRELNRAMGWNLPDDEAATVAGLVIHEARSIPEPRQTFSFHSFRFEVLRKQRNRIAALRITPLAPRALEPRAISQEGETAPHD